jgi:hypothetical protein
MAISIKTIKGRRYAYHQTSKRIGKKVKTTSTYIGPVNSKAFISLFSAQSRAFMASPVAELFKEKATPEAPLIIAGLTFAPQPTAEESFLHESGLSPSSETSQGSSQESATSSEE